MLHHYDASGDKCPLPLVKMRLILKKMQLGDSCLIRISDKGSKKNIPQYLKKFSWHFQQIIIDENTIELEITK